MRFESGMRKTLWALLSAFLLSFPAHAADPASSSKSKTLKNSNSARVLRGSKKTTTPPAVEGCTYPASQASNASATAVLDDGSCNFDAYILSRPEGVL